MVPPSDGYDSHSVVPRGLIFSHDTYIPLDAVVQRSGTDVFINVPKLVAGKMPWDQPPTVAERKEKEGPAAASFDHLYGSFSPSGERTSSSAEAVANPPGSTVS